MTNRPDFKVGDRVVLRELHLGTNAPAKEVLYAAPGERGTVTGVRPGRDELSLKWDVPNGDDGRNWSTGWFDLVSEDDEIPDLVADLTASLMYHQQKQHNAEVNALRYKAAVEYAMTFLDDERSAMVRGFIDGFKASQAD